MSRRLDDGLRGAQHERADALAVARAKLLTDERQAAVGRVAYEHAALARSDEELAVLAVINVELSDVIEYVDRAILYEI